jgi:hypothetical protein
MFLYLVAIKFNDIINSIQNKLNSHDNSYIV